MPNKLKQTTFHIEKMDCPCEERLIRMSLEACQEDIEKLEFNLQERRLRVTHSGNIHAIADQIARLNLGEEIENTIDLDVNDADRHRQAAEDSDSLQRKLLLRVLTVNALFFVFELSVGIIGRSMGLIADSLDMLADALVYGMSLLAVGTLVTTKKKVALASGIIQLVLAGMGIIEVIRRWLTPTLQPDSMLMIVMSALALAANAYCLWLLSRHQSKEAHIRASVIFSANDVVINMGVMLTGAAVWQTQSRIPDLLIGTIVFIIVVHGAVRILRLAS